tara:strand:+ start:84 stop:599 length:516 start_codon:yes stop_codon:yes gene_type:complete
MDLTDSLRTPATFEDGELWYVRPSGRRERLASYVRKNTTRMFVNGKYIPKSNPLHKPGRYKSLDDAWSHQKIEQTREGEIYAITNTAWINWYKIGKAVNAEDRLNAYQTGSPFRNYELVMFYKVSNRHVAERSIHKFLVKKKYNKKGEWFYVEDLEDLNAIFNKEEKKYEE